MAKNYWLIKSDPEEFSIEDLKNSKDKTTTGTVCAITRQEIL